MRLLVLRLMMLRRTRWLVEMAEYIATAHDTNDNLRKPFQFGLDAMNHTPERKYPVETRLLLASSLLREWQWPAPFAQGN
jgi:hypothetical protein